MCSGKLQTRCCRTAHAGIVQLCNLFRQFGSLYPQDGPDAVPGFRLKAARDVKTSPSQVLDCRLYRLSQQDCDSVGAGVFVGCAYTQAQTGQVN